METEEMFAFCPCVIDYEKGPCEAQPSPQGWALEIVNP